MLFAAGTLAPHSAGAQGARAGGLVDSVITLIERGYASGKPGALDAAISLADAALAEDPGDGVMLHYKGYALYRKGALMIATRASGRDVKAVLNGAERTLAQSAAVLAWPETPALRASVVGQLIGVSSKLSAMRLGSRAEGFMDAAVRLGPDNPRVLMLRGVGAIFKPRMFGGGTKKAEADLKRAIELFVTERPVSPAPSWGHAEAYAWLGQVHAKEKRVDDARSAYLKALEIQPDYPWVRDDLMPALDLIRP